jgi:Uma2 family endonuclease
MSSAARITPPEIDYPDSDGKPMAETPRHCQNMTDSIEVLEVWFADDPKVYVSGNMSIYYERGNPRKHISPDVFVVRGVAKDKERRMYLVWEEGGKNPDAVIEMTSKSTRKEDIKDTFGTYQDTLKVREYFLFDSYAEYLDPPLLGYRLRQGRYAPIRPSKGRIPSQVLGLHLERDGWQLRFFDPTTQRQLLTHREAREHVESQNAALHRELEALRKKLGQAD